MFGVALNLTTYFLTRGTNLVITIVLARSLGPEGMGLIAAVALAVELVDLVTGFGLRESLIYERGSSRSLESAAFAIVMFISGLQMAALSLAAPWSVVLVEDPQIVPVMMWIALLFPVTALGLVPEAVLLKERRFRQIALAEALAVIVKAALAIGLVLLGFGVWSFVAGLLGGQIVRTSAFWLLSRWRPSRPDLSLSTARRLLGYGQHIVLTSFIGLLRQRSDQMAILGALSEAALGTYFVASRVVDITLMGVNAVVSRIVFPTFSAASDDRDLLRRMYLRTINGSMLVMAPISVGVASISTLFVPVVFGPEWSAAAPVLVLLSLSGIPKTVGWTAGDVFKATGRPGVLARLTVVQACVTVPLVFGLGFATHDLVWIAAGMVAGEFVGAMLRIRSMQTCEDIHFSKTIGAVLMPVLSSLLMGGAVLAAQEALGAWSPGPKLLASIALGVAVYPAILMVTDFRNCLRWVRVLASAGQNKG